MYNVSKFIKKNMNPYFWRAYSSAIYILLIPVRAKIASGYLFPSINLAVKWLFVSREISNFSYNLSSTNKNYLAHTISVVTGQNVEKIKTYLNEIETNKLLKQHVAASIRTSTDNFRVGPLVAYGRRIGWYAVVRAIKPKIVVETGVDQGLGSCIIAEALRRNSEEGKNGRYFGTDILPEAGALFIGNYKKHGEILYGDSIKSLRKFKHKIDLFINDSDHHPEYERREYQVIRSLLKEKSILLGDNSHGSEELCKFAERTNRHFIFFKEQPKDHWYPGAGIGIAYGKIANKEKI